MAMTARYTSVRGEVLSQFRSGVRRLIVPDAIGSTVALVNTSQVKTDTITYWPYGEVGTRTGTTTIAFQFVGSFGYVRDSAARTYVRHRTLRTNTGAWQTIDRRWPNDRAYTYTKNSPCTYIDFYGLQVLALSVGAMGGAGLFGLEFDCFVYLDFNKSLWPWDWGLGSGFNYSGGLGVGLGGSVGPGITYSPNPYDPGWDKDPVDFGFIGAGGGFSIMNLLSSPTYGPGKFRGANVGPTVGAGIFAGECVSYRYEFVCYEVVRPILDPIVDKLRRYEMDVNEWIRRRMMSQPGMQPGFRIR